jgi:phosphoribosyl 1,2-cyclic phosphodiesterase
MRIKVLGSSSKGNCYLLTNDKESLLIEAGVRKNLIYKSMNNNIESLQNGGCIISHRHSDHAKYLNDILKMEVTCYALSDVFSSRNIENRKAINIETNRTYNIGNFNVSAFEVKHDCDCVGYLIYHKDMGNLLFITDCNEIDTMFHNFKINHIMIECNYTYEKLYENYDSGKINNAQLQKSYTHLSLTNTKEFLQTQVNMKYVQDIMLIHLSSANGDKEKMKREIQEITGVEVIIAEKEIEKQLEKIL